MWALSRLSIWRSFRRLENDASRSEKEKSASAEEITRAVTKTLVYGPDAVSVGIEKVAPKDRTGHIFAPTSQAKRIHFITSAATASPICNEVRRFPSCRDGYQPPRVFYRSGNLMHTSSRSS